MIRPDMKPLAEELGVAPFNADSAAKQFLGAYLYPKILAMAIYERSDVVTVARGLLREQVEGRA